MVEEQARNLEVSVINLTCGTVSVLSDSQIKVMRRSGGNRLFAFAPANDLSLISRSSDHAEGLNGRQRGKEGLREVDVQGGKVLGDEWAEHVVENRNGIMLRAS
jgi:hypothetical protein